MGLLLYNPCYDDRLERERGRETKRERRERERERKMDGCSEYVTRVCNGSLGMEGSLC